MLTGAVLDYWPEEFCVSLTLALLCLWLRHVSQGIFQQASKSSGHIPKEAWFDNKTLLVTSVWTGCKSPVCLFLAYPVVHPYLSNALPY
jgi:hypothetical protein